MSHLLLTLGAGAVLGLAFLRLKVPGGMMVGAMVGVAAFNIGTGLAYMPATARLAAQITAGAFIGASVEKRDLRRMPKLIKPALILLGGMLILNLARGPVIHALSGLDWMTSFFCAVPGGISDTPIIAADMGADAGDVALAQFSRLVAGIGIFPSLILAMTRHDPQGEEGAHQAGAADRQKDPASVALTIAVAAVCGFIGKRSGVPVGTLLFAMLGVIALKLLTDRAAVPLWLKRLAQLLSGAYIGSSMGLADLLEMRVLLLPIVLLVLAYLLNCLVISALLHRFCGIRRREAMLAATPAGANDMALISGDLGVHSQDLNVLQIIRMIVVVSVFPQIVRLVVSLLEGPRP